MKPKEKENRKKWSKNQEPVDNFRHPSIYEIGVAKGDERMRGIEKNTLLNN